MDTLDDIEGDEHWHYITLEDRAAYHTDAAERWAEDAVAELELQQRRVDRGRTSTPLSSAWRRDWGSTIGPAGGGAVVDGGDGGEPSDPNPNRRSAPPVIDR